MSAHPDIAYDPERWIHVPLDYADTAWANAGEWAAWVAAAASRGRPEAEDLRREIESAARQIALFPAAHVSARLWHFPTDGDPTGFVDMYVQERSPDGTAAADLLPEPGFTVVDPVVEPFAATHMPDAARRLSLVAVLPDGRDEPALMPKAEWIGAAGGRIAYAVSVDHDTAALSARLDDIGAVFAGFDPTAPAPEEIHS